LILHTASEMESAIWSSICLPTLQMIFLQFCLFLNSEKLWKTSSSDECNVKIDRRRVTHVIIGNSFNDSKRRLWQRTVTGLIPISRGLFLRNRHHLIVPSHSIAIPCKEDSGSIHIPSVVGFSDSFQSRDLLKSNTIEISWNSQQFKPDYRKNDLIVHLLLIRISFQPSVGPIFRNEMADILTPSNHSEVFIVP
jgi:hypothetical protein